MVFSAALRIALMLGSAWLIYRLSFKAVSSWQKEWEQSELHRSNALQESISRLKSSVKNSQNGESDMTEMVVRVNNGVRITVLDMPPYRVFVGRDAFVDFPEDKLPEFLLGRLTMIRARDELPLKITIPKPDSEIGWRKDMGYTPASRGAYVVVVNNEEIKELRSMPLNFLDIEMTPSQLMAMEVQDHMKAYSGPMIVGVGGSGTVTPGATTAGSVTHTVYGGGGSGSWAQSNYSNQNSIQNSYAQQAAAQQAMNQLQAQGLMNATAKPKVVK